MDGDDFRVLGADIYFRSGFPFAIAKYNHTQKEFAHIAPAVREFWKITYIENGAATLEFSGRRYKLRAGSIYLMHPDLKTLYHITEEPLSVCNILFTKDFLKEFLPDLMRRFHFFSVFTDDFVRQKKIPFYAQESSRPIRTMVMELEQEYFRKEINYHLNIKLNLMRLLLQFQRESAFLESGRERIVSEIRSMLEEDLRRNFSLTDLAKHFSVSKQHLCHLYKQQTGRSIIEDVNECRMDHAAELLLNGATPISEICYRCGFNDLSYFYRTFKQRFGLNPGEFRKHGK